MAEPTTMYVLSKGTAVVRERASKKWERALINNIACDTLFAKYCNIEFVVVDAYGDLYHVDAYDYETELRFSELTLDQWVANLGDRSLKVTPGDAVLETATANYFPLWHRKTSAVLAKRGWHPSHYTTADDADDVVVTMEGVEHKHLNDHILWSVNGFFMPTTYHAYGCRIYNAGDIIRKSGRMSIGGLNFENVGNVTFQDITPEHVSKVESTRRYFDGVHIKVDEPIGKKTVGIIIGGYLHLLDGLIRPISEHAIRFTPGDLNIVERVLLSKDYLDLEFMGLDGIEKGALVSTVMDDDNWLKYLTCQYSRLVFIDTPDLWRTHSYVDTVTRPGSYLTEEDDNLSQLVDNRGRTINYWPKFECGKVALCSEDFLEPTHARYDTNWFEQTVFNDAMVGQKPYVRINPKMYHYHTRKK